MPDTSIRIEVVYAAVDRQVLLVLDVPVGSTVRQALEMCGIERQFPDLNLAQSPVGIFGKVLNDPSIRVIEAGERIEIYRPLLADPKEVRRQRAAKARLNRAT